MPLEPEVTVYIPSKNYAQFLDEAIGSVLAQSAQNWELILIDDNSNDTSFQKMEKYSDDSRISIHKVSGIGLPAVANFALKKASGKYFLRLDGDDYLNKFALEILTSVMENNKDLDFAFPDFYEIDDEGRLLSLHTAGQINNYDHYRGQPPHGACTIWRTEKLKDLGGYREDLKSQDGLDVWIKSNQNENFTNIALPLFYYRKHDSNLTNSKELISNARRSLKLSEVNKIKNKPKITVVIPCRSKYDFVPNLWNVKIHGKSLLSISLETCLSSSLVDNILVLGDNPEIHNHIKDFSRKDQIDNISYVERNSTDTRENIPLVDALKEYVQNDKEIASGVILIKHLQAPFVTTSDIDEILCALILDGATSSALVSKLDWTLLSRNRYGLHVIYERNFISTNMERFFQYRNTVMATLGINLKKSSLWGASTTYIEGSNLSNFVLENKHSIEIAEAMWAKNNHVE